MDVAKDISEGLARNVLSASFNGKIVESVTPLREDGILSFTPGMTMRAKGILALYSTYFGANPWGTFYPGLNFGWVLPSKRAFITMWTWASKPSEKDFKTIEYKMLWNCKREARV